MESVGDYDCRSRVKRELEASLHASRKQAPLAQSRSRLFERNPPGEWYWVTGWSDNPETPPLSCLRGSKTQDQDWRIRKPTACDSEPITMESPGVSPARINGEKRLSLATTALCRIGRALCLHPSNRDTQFRKFCAL